ncbi:MAG: protein-disulfide reductase DsbD domain-containing protein [Pseudomonadota bacterium]
MPLLRPILLSLAALWLTCGVVLAASSPAYVSDRITARLITAENGVAPEATTISAALEVQLSEGWKTYWRSPGAVGYPVEIDWTGSANLERSETMWPAPKRFTAFEIENYGYETAVTFPIRITLSEPGDMLVATGAFNLLVCAELCVPEMFELTLVLPPGTAIDRDAGALIAEAAAKLPVSAELSDITVDAAVLDLDAKRLDIALTSETPFRDLSVIPDLGLDGAFGPPQIAMSAGGTAATVHMDVLAAPADPPSLRLVVTDATRAVEVTPDLTGALPTSAVPGNSLAWFFLLAFIGGVILNFMPCVLPVLTIKFASVVKATDQSAARVRAGFLMSALGVLAFMWALAVILLAIRASGGSIGWGIQFQNPYFLTAITAIITLFAANLFGLFEITLPQSWNTSLAARGGDGSLLGDFSIGAFAAILATPCSAPFLGTAVTFALAGTAPQTLTIFTALGLGLALPYLLVAVWPSAVRVLPKPGPWMTKLKWVMGLFLIATAIWLLFVISGVVGQSAMLAIAACLLGLIALLHVLKSGALRSSAVTALLCVSIALPAAFARPAPTVAPAGEMWAAFDPSGIGALVSDGKTVFVDVTADWCLSCKANKALVLDRMPVSQLLTAEHVVAMQGDWTRPDETILAYLQSHGRFGIPFNIVYGPGAPEGIALPELLTPAVVRDALEQASG